MAEQAACAAAVHCTADEVRAQRLRGSDFLLRGCGQVWDAALAAAAEDGAPSVLGVGTRLGPRALEELQRWVGDWWTYCHPAGLRAHAAIIRRASTRRRRLAELAAEAARVGRGDSRVLGTGGVSIDFVEQPVQPIQPIQPGQSGQSSQPADQSSGRPSARPADRHRE